MLSTSDHPTKRLVISSLSLLSTSPSPLSFLEARILQESNQHISCLSDIKVSRSTYKRQLVLPDLAIMRLSVVRCGIPTICLLGRRDIELLTLERVPVERSDSPPELAVGDGRAQNQLGCILRVVIFDSGDTQDICSRRQMRLVRLGIGQGNENSTS